MALWHTPESVRKFWKDAPADDDVCAAYLAAARDAVVAYAPPLPEDYDPAEWPLPGEGSLPGDPPQIPDSYALAQCMQARNMWNSGNAGANGFDGSEYGITVHPLDWQIKQILRPRRGLGAIA